MNIEHLKDDRTDIAVISSDEKVIVDVQSALDLAMTVKYETGAAAIVIGKSAVCDDFFVLSSGMAGEILQKFINNDFFFVSTKDEAIQKLKETQ